MTTSFEASSGEPVHDKNKPNSTAPPPTPQAYGVEVFKDFDFSADCGCVSYKGEIVQGCDKHRRRY